MILWKKEIRPSIIEEDYVQQTHIDRILNLYFYFLENDSKDFNRHGAEGSVLSTNLKRETEEAVTGEAWYHGFTEGESVFASLNEFILGSQIRNPITGFCEIFQDAARTGHSLSTFFGKIICIYNHRDQLLGIYFPWTVAGNEAHRNYLFFSGTETISEILFSDDTVHLILHGIHYEVFIPTPFREKRTRNKLSAAKEERSVAVVDGNTWDLDKVSIDFTQNVLLKEKAAKEVEDTKNRIDAICDILSNVEKEYKDLAERKVELQEEEKRAKKARRI